jgi:hypothetical protein
MPALSSLARTPIGVQNPYREPLMTGPSVIRTAVLRDALDVQLSTDLNHALNALINEAVGHGSPPAAGLPAPAAVTTINWGRIALVGTAAAAALYFVTRALRKAA